MPPHRSRPRFTPAPRHRHRQPHRRPPAAPTTRHGDHITPTLIHDNYQNHRRSNVPKAQLITADIPYNIGGDAYGSNPQWYVDGDNKNGESALASTQFFNTARAFKITEFMHFASRMLKPDPKERGTAPELIVFCEFDQQRELIEAAPQYGCAN